MIKKKTITKKLSGTRFEVDLLKKINHLSIEMNISVSNIMHSALRNYYYRNEWRLKK